MAFSILRSGVAAPQKGETDAAGFHLCPVDILPLIIGNVDAFHIFPIRRDNGSGCVRSVGVFSHLKGAGEGSGFRSGIVYVAPTEIKAIGIQGAALSAVVGLSLPGNPAGLLPQLSGGSGVVIVLSPFVHAHLDAPVGTGPVGVLSDSEGFALLNLPAFSNVVTVLLPSDKALGLPKPPLAAGVIIAFSPFVYADFYLTFFVRPIGVFTHLERLSGLNSAAFSNVILISVPGDKSGFLANLSLAVPVKIIISLAKDPGFALGFGRFLGRRLDRVRFFYRKTHPDAVFI